MRDVAVESSGLTSFGRHDLSVVDLLAMASLEALEASGTDSVDAVFVGNMSSGEFEGKSGIASALVSELGMEPAFPSKVE
ncbi:MAG: thiolase family protein, partial [Thermoplasmata archaeon]|nr:thiolase family protein [Thermoplasmata archaeon]